ncbi:phosphonatase-like hydrolase [Pseudarcicella hirudinis]|uniref:Phosphonatase-like hydrolase n=1 Tax=Pseudarcicella hirudinis TaxID=1079859 RepID=A0A1I5NP70_9BACT|nr:HAD-IA family hydrolase [Pseudarcicella hirudinis]SFP23106.1 phosphonatase-like hydrolase [Pseudarcicella hirudinis]
MNIKLVIFDLAGTTFHDKGNVTQCFQEAMKTYGYAIPTEIVNALMGYKKNVAIRMMLDQYESDTTLITDSLIDKIHTCFVDNMIAFYQNSLSIDPLPNVENVFRSLKSQQVKIGLDTGFSKDIANIILTRLGWLENGLVDFLVASDEVPQGRPYPYMIQKIMEQAGVKNSEEVVKVGDTEVDINEGINAGCKYSVAVTTGAFTREALEPYKPSFIIDDMIDLLPILAGTNLN